MKQIVTTPYLPSYEYVPDGEPHVFGDRLYIFGSHDRFGGKHYCENDYVCGSAPADDLSDWRYEGVIYRREQDPDCEGGKRTLYAPDVAKGPDGRFYLYYGPSFINEVHVAVADTPAGPYSFYGKVSWPDGTVFGKRKKEPLRFDPGVLVDEDDRVYLYTGFCPKDFWLRALAGLAGVTLDGEGSTVVELGRDMLTVIGKPTHVIPGYQTSQGARFEGYEFYEASSMRKFNGRYYAIYSTINSHELAYAIGDSPLGPFRFGGVLHSNGNFGFNEVAEPQYYWGNNHGSIELVNGSFYVFGHRQTNQHEFSRQGVAEPLVRRSDGTFQMAEMTSVGLYGEALPCEISYEAGIACVLYAKDGAKKTVLKKSEKKRHPYITQTGTDRECDPEQYIANLQKGNVAGYKYFEIPEETMELRLSIRSHGKESAGGPLLISAFPDFSELCGVVDFTAGAGMKEITVELQMPTGKQPLYLKYEGKGAIDLFQILLRPLRTEVR